MAPDERIAAGDQEFDVDRVTAEPGSASESPRV
jgi:hypothetical protein